MMLTDTLSGWSLIAFSVHERYFVCPKYVLYVLCVGEIDGLTGNAITKR
jgi:hypothetical protein